MEIVPTTGSALAQSDLPTRSRVAQSILVNGPSTAVALAERLELTPAAVRRHLDQLLAEGAVDRRRAADAAIGEKLQAERQLTGNPQVGSAAVDQLAAQFGLRPEQAAAAVGQIRLAGAWQEALAARRRIGDPGTVRIARWMVAWALRNLGRDDQALDGSDSDIAGDGIEDALQALEYLPDANGNLIPDDFE